MSLNARGLRNTFKRKSVLAWIKNQKADIIFLQETHSTENCEALWKKEWKGKIFFSHGTEFSKGVITLIKDDLDCQVNTVECDKGGRYVILNTLVQETPLILTNIYAPDKEKDQENFYKTVSSLFSSEYKLGREQTLRLLAD